MFGKSWTLCLEVTAPDDLYNTWSTTNPDNLIGKVSCLVARANVTIIWAQYAGDMSELLDRIAHSTVTGLRIDIWYIGNDNPYAGYQSATGGLYTIGETAANRPFKSPFYDECHDHCCPNCAVTRGYVTKVELEQGIAGYNRMLAEFDGLSDSFPL